MALHVQCPKCSQKLAVNTPPPPPPPRHKWIAGGVLIGFAIALPAFLILAELMKGDAIRSLEDQVRAANVKASDALDAQLQAEADSRRDLALLRDSNEALKQEAATSEERRKLLVGILEDFEGTDTRCRSRFDQSRMDCPGTDRTCDAVDISGCDKGDSENCCGFEPIYGRFANHQLKILVTTRLDFLFPVD